MAGRRAVVHANDEQKIYNAFNKGEDYLYTLGRAVARQAAYAIVKRAESRDGIVACYAVVSGHPKWMKI